MELRKIFSNNPNRLQLLAAVFVAFAIGLFAGSKMPKRQSVIDVNTVRASNVNYKFINPLLALDYANNKEFFEFKPFEAKIIDLINTEKSSGNASDVGFYFTDFSNGHWVGVGENTPFYPASLLKVPIMISFFREAETNPDILNKQVTYPGGQDFNQLETTKPSVQLQTGQQYTIEQLIEHMIEYSDNNATQLLLNNLDQNSYNDVYTDLGIDVPKSSAVGTSDYFTAKQYSLILRILRNATYLNRDYSEKALEIMSKTDFNDGLPAGVPAGTPVAHKFGEFESADPLTGKPYYELHDCGIIYPQNNHSYQLCVMTKGLDHDKLKGVIKDISNLVYTEVNNNYQ